MFFKDITLILNYDYRIRCSNLFYNEHGANIRYSE